ncbi:MAG: bifunctional 2-polyprenyl-6-hydroxyphenol methylase/3-demethylubiquinol 3-O-methyltransferase UbiG, partial [Gammaproteobacteria bacterium]
VIMTMTKPAATSNDTRQHDFGQHADRWWDSDGPLRTLHGINPARLEYILDRIGATDSPARLAGQQALDIGCGGGVLTEALAQAGARVTGLDLSAELIAVARTHAQTGGLTIDYRQGRCENLLPDAAGHFDIITCLEMLEHVDDPGAVIAACTGLAKPGGHIFFSTLDRSPAAWLLAIVAAEHLLRLLPRGTHDYQQFIRPAELAACCREAGLEVLDISGLHYVPGLNRAFINSSPGVNYLLHARRPLND